MTLSPRRRGIGKSGRRAATRSQPPLEMLTRPRGGGETFLGDLQIQAARRLQGDFERAQLRQRLTLDMESALPRDGAAGANVAPCLAALDAKRRCLEALDAAGPGLGDLLFETVCMEHGLVEAERLFGWPARSAKAILGLALDRLVEHYGLVSGTRRAGRIEIWRQNDEAA